MSALYFEITDPLVTVGITVFETGDGSLTFDLEVLTETGSIGDLNALFFDFLDPALLDGLSIEGQDVTDVAIKEDGVTKLDNFTNMNGEIVNEYGKFDVGVQFGTQGISKDDIQTTSFTLDHDTEELSLDYLLAQDFAARLTSVGEIDGAREESLKIGETAPDEPTVVGDPTDDPIGDDGGDPPAEPVNIANDDTMTVFEWETFNEHGEYDEVNENGQSLLENDTTDEFIYTGLVTGVNDQALTEGTYEGSNGGLLIVTAEGRVDFSANGAFDGLEEGQTGSTTFTYMIEGGDMALINVNVLGSSEPMDDFADGDGLPDGDFIPDDEWVEPGFEIG